MSLTGGQCLWETGWLQSPLQMWALDFETLQYFKRRTRWKLYWWYNIHYLQHFENIKKFQEYVLINLQMLYVRSTSWHNRNGNIHPHQSSELILNLIVLSWSNKMLILSSILRHNEDVVHVRKDLSIILWKAAAQNTGIHFYFWPLTTFWLHPLR